MPRQKKPRDTSFYGGPQDLGGHYPGKIGPGNPSRATAFSRDRQPERTRFFNRRNAPAEEGWSSYQLRDPDRRPKSLLITDVADLGADLLEEMVSYDVGGRTENIPFILAAMKRARKYLIGDSRRDFTEGMRFYRELGAFERLAHRQTLRADALEERNKEWWQGYYDRLISFGARLEAWDKQATPEQKEALDRECAELEEQRRLKALEAKERRRRRSATEDDRSAVSPRPAVTDQLAADEAVVISRDFAITASADQSSTGYAVPADGEPLSTPGTDPVADDSGDAPGVPATETVPATPSLQSETANDPNDLWAPETLVGHGRGEPEASPEAPDDDGPATMAVPPSNDHPSDITDIAEEGEIVFWTRRGSGYQQIRSKAGWNHGPRTKR